MIIAYYFIFLATCIFVIYACFPALSMFFALFIKRFKPNFDKTENSFACIITAYKEYEIAIPLVESLLKQNYQRYHIYLVADNCIVTTEVQQNEILTVLFPEKPLNGKVLSIKYAIDHFVENHEVVLILDSDNLLHYDALKHLNSYINAGYTAVQGQRTAKNLDTTVAAIDALSELYYNYSQRDTAFRLGSSATIAGSGMAVRTAFFSQYIHRLFDEGKQFEIAEDKLLQMMLIQHKYRIAYCRDALIFDEKVLNGNQVQRQRTRWIRSWFQHWESAVNLMFSGVLKLNWNMFYFGLMLSFPPMFLLVLGLLIIIILGLFIDIIFSNWAIIGLLVFVIQFFMAMIFSYTPQIIWLSLPKIPIFIWRQFLAVLKIKTTSRTDFMATSHSQFVGIDEVWQKRQNDFPYLLK